MEAECHLTGPSDEAIRHHLLEDCQRHHLRHFGWASVDASRGAESSGEESCSADPAGLMDSNKRTQCLCPSHLADVCDGKTCPAGLPGDDGFWYSIGNFFLKSGIMQ